MTPTRAELEAKAEATSKAAMKLTDCTVCQAVFVTLQAIADAGAARPSLQELAAANDISAGDAADAHVAKAALLFAIHTFRRIFPRNPAAFFDVFHQTLRQCGVSTRTMTMDEFLATRDSPNDSGTTH